jgi:hypothetical protein
MDCRVNPRIKSGDGMTQAGYAASDGGIASTA